MNGLLNVDAYAYMRVKMLPFRMAERVASYDASKYNR